MELTDNITMKVYPPKTVSRLFVIRRSLFNRAAEKIASVGFFIFFPGFLIYHLLVAATLLPPFLGGLFGYSAALFAFLLPLISFPFFKKYLSTSPFYIGTFLIFIIYVLSWTIAHWAFVYSNEIEAASIQSIETLVLWVAMFFVGMLLPRISFSFSVLYSTLFYIMFSALVLYVAITGKAMFYARHIFNPEEIISYQVLARSALAIIIVALVGQRALAARSMVIIVGGLATLYILGARSELVAFLLLDAALLALFTMRDPRHFLYSAICGFVLVLVLLLSEIEIQNRQSELIDLAASSSWQTRICLQNMAIAQIAQNPFFGLFGGHVLEGGSTSSYSHNALSAWVNYGVLGFLSYIMLTVIATIISIYYISKRSFGEDWLLSFCFNFVSLVLMIGAKPVFWPIPALGWGLYVRAMSRMPPLTSCCGSKRYS